MDIDQLKQSWNQIDEQLKNIQLIKKENISRLKEYVSSDAEKMRKARVKGRIIAVCILIPIAILILIGCILQRGPEDDLTVIIAFMFAIPALIWDVYSTNYLSKIKIEEMPLKEVITRFNKYYSWASIETFIGFAFLLGIIIFYFISNRLWEGEPWRIGIFVIIWAIAAHYPIKVSKKEWKRLRRVRKNLAELKDLDD